MGEQLTPDQVYNIIKTWPPAEQRAFLQELERLLSNHYRDEVAYAEEQLNQAHKRTEIFNSPQPMGASVAPPLREGVISQKIGQ